MRLPAPIALQAGALLGGAALCALASNALARPERRLAWAGTPPPRLIAVPAPAVAPLQAAAPQGAQVPAPGRARPAPEAPKPPRAEAFPAQASQPIREIGGTEAAEAFRAGIPFLDARRRAEYDLGHIQGAWSLPIWESTLEEHLVEFEARVNRPPEAPLVLYCSGGSCEDSHLLASRLFQMGYRNLLIYREGYPEWTDQGRPITKGAAR